MNFAHLHVHTEFSLLDGSSKIKEITARAKELGMNSLAITDHGVMYGAIDFYRAANANGIKPIIGCEVYVAPGSRFTKEAGESEDRYYHLVLLAENNKGYSNLSKIVSKGFVDGFYYKPRVDYEVLQEFHEGIICLSACLAGEVQRYLARGMYEEGKKAALKYQDIFGKGNYFLEMQDHGIPEQRMVNQQLMRMSQETGIELVCTNDVHYTYDTDVEAHDILLCIQTGKKQSDENRMRYEGGQYYLKSPEEMAELFKFAPEALENTQKIADRCNVTFEFGVTKLPNYEVPEGYTPATYLRELCNNGLQKRYVDTKLDYDCPMPLGQLKERLDYELSTIETMGYVEYFLIVWDFINYAKTNGIAVGPGRGSAAGSIVSYCLEITDIDPIRYNLLFERFLNPERVSMPDIDIDFCIERRQEVIDYVGRKYGKDHVAQIVTFGTLKARGVLRDVGRVLDMPYAQVDAIAKTIPKELNITLDGALKESKEFKDLYESDEQIKYLVDMSRRLEGLPRHASMHAAGVVICAKPVEEYVPLSRASDGSITTQYIMTTLEELGLLKMDFLGLRNLTVIQNAVRFVEKDHNIKLDMHSIDYDDKKVLASIGTGNTEGIFQLESGGMKGFMKELKPQNLEDIIAGISLYRPGPMDFIPKYLEGKNNPEAITYDCPQLEHILEPTYGCIVYQEQVMQIVRDLAGYTLGRSDLVRRAMSKKKDYVMQQERQNFVYGNKEENVPGCIANGIDEKTANKIYDDMIDFAKYAFNKSHATCYSWVAYQTAYLKANYPSEYMAAVMSRSLSNITDITKLMDECKAMGIQTLGPDVNESNLKFTVNRDGNIRFGLGAVKGVGEAAVQSIMEEREKNGPFTGIFDFVQRVNLNACNKKNMECLALAGGFDSFPELKREQYFAVNSKGEVFLETLMRYGNRYQADKAAAVNSLFGGENVIDVATPEIPQGVERWSDLDRLNRERDLVGIYLSAHPLDEFSIVLEHVCNTRMADLEDKAALAGREITMGGIVTSVRRGISKNGNPYGIAKIEDYSGSTEIPFWGNDWVTYQGYLNEGTFLFIKARCQPKQWRQDELEVKITSMELLPDVKEELVQKITIIIPLSVLNSALITELATLTKEHPGNTELYFRVTDDIDVNRMAVDLISRPVKLSVGRELITYLKDRPELGFRIN